MEERGRERREEKVNDRKSREKPIGVGRGV